jgi:hypothetical protein
LPPCTVGCFMHGGAMKTGRPSTSFCDSNIGAKRVAGAAWPTTKRAAGGDLPFVVAWLICDLSSCWLLFRVGYCFKTGMLLSASAARQDAPGPGGASCLTCLGLKRG